MDSNWALTTLEDLADIIDSRHKTPIYSDHGFPMVRVVDVKGGRLNLAETKKVAPEVYADFSKGRDPEIGDLVISRVGSLGCICYVESTEKFCLGQNTALIIPKSSGRLLYYQLTSPQVQSQMELMSVGAVQKTISLKSIKQLKLWSIPDQEALDIADFLSSIDNKIELNTQLNQTLESMAQAMFKSWFIDFDPVIDNAIAAGNPIPEPFQARAARRRQRLYNQVPEGDSPLQPLPAELRQLFPNSFQETEELGWVPEGWAMESLHQQAEYVNGAAFKSCDFVERRMGLPVVKIAELKAGISAQTKYSSKKLDQKYYIDSGSILFSWSGNPDTSIDTFLWHRGEALLNQHVFHVIPKTAVEKSYVYLLLKHKRPEFSAIARDKQTTGLGHVTLADLKRLKISRASHQVVCKFSELSDPIVSRFFGVLLEVETLTSLRNVLLPKLLSGQLRIPDVETQLAEAGL